MIAHGDIRAMHCVDQIKVAPHKPIASVHMVEAALKNAAPGVELAPRRQTRLLQAVGQHAARLKRDAIVAVSLIQPPGVVEESLFRLEPPVKWRAWERRQVIEGGDVKRVLLCKG